MATTALPTSFKQELLWGAHCFGATMTPTGTCASAAASVTSVSSMTGVCVGMAVTGTNIPASTKVLSTTSSTAFTLSQNTTGTITGGTFTISGDVFKIALIKTSPSGTYDSTVTNAGTPGSGTPSSSNIGTDEVSGTGYTSGGVTLTNVSPATSGTTAWVAFSPDPSWSGASFSTVACVIYNTSSRLAGVSNRAVYIGDLGGTQTVTSGTLTLVGPAQNSSSALIRLA